MNTLANLLEWLFRKALAVERVRVQERARAMLREYWLRTAIRDGDIVVPLWKRD